jgi:hypothetical protein
MVENHHVWLKCVSAKENFMTWRLGAIPANLFGFSKKQQKSELAHGVQS